MKGRVLGQFVVLEFVEQHNGDASVVSEKSCHVRSLVRALLPRGHWYIGPQSEIFIPLILPIPSIFGESVPKKDKQI